nr:hypothetical protein [Bradyrhizobium cosmicum]QDP20644.1 hypothetical protein FNV92_00085 [Bradyrhizobium cosmicum]QDP20695.1 hypothetical protein FNV92_00360 [Bradyrhizobium cosmicum]
MATEQRYGDLRVDPAPPGAPYDYVARIKNVVDLGYNPENKDVRDGMALRLLSKQCANPKVVGESQITTGTYLGGTKPMIEYLVQVKC